MASTTLAFVAVFVVLSALHHEAQGARTVANLTNTRQDFTSQFPLVPGLVTTEPTIYKLSELTWGNHYKAELVMSGSTMANQSKSDKDFALQFKGEHSQRPMVGHDTMLVTDPSTGKEFFKVRASRNSLNPKEWIGRFSYRILPPGSKEEKDSIFTINKDYIGQGVWGLKEEWRIYRGRKRDGQLAYYCVGNYTFWDATCYHSVEEYETGRDCVLKLHTKFGVATVLDEIANVDGTAIELPDAQYLTMQPEADAALFLAFGVILDTTTEPNWFNGHIDDDDDDGDDDSDDDGDDDGIDAQLST